MRVPTRADPQPLLGTLKLDAQLARIRKGKRAQATTSGRQRQVSRMKINLSVHNQELQTEAGIESAPGKHQRSQAVGHAPLEAFTLPASESRAP